MSVAECLLDNGAYWVQLCCDRCGQECGTWNPTRDECNSILLAVGWRLYRKQTLCPACANKRSGARRFA